MKEWIKVLPNVSYETTGFKWINPKEELPEDPEEFVLVVVNGKVGELTLIGAFELATYDADDPDGWILETWPMEKNIKVKWWAHIPDAPEEDEDGQ